MSLGPDSCLEEKFSKDNCYEPSVRIILVSSSTLICRLSTIFICPIAIAHSMGQIIKSVCVCQSVSLCTGICLSASTLRSHFLIGFSPKLAQT